MASERGKAPAFQFYSNDWDSDEKQAVMSLAEAGAYIRLIAKEWSEGSIPSDLDRLARLARCSSDEMRAVWPAISDAFVPHPTRADRLIHPRLEKERGKQEAYRLRAANGGYAKAAKTVLTACLKSAKAPAKPVLNACLKSALLSSSSEQETASATPTPLALVAAWNDSVSALPKVVGLSSGRERKARARLGECPDLGIWREVFGRLNASPFCCGLNDRHWRADFDFALQPDTRAKVLEGKYDERGKNQATGCRRNHQPPCANDAACTSRYMAEQTQ